jgi:membrane-associated phospholipid phosphatase
MNRNKNYQDLYNKWTQPFLNHPLALNLCRTLNRIFTLIPFLMYPALLIVLWMQRDSRLLRIICVPAMSFLVLSIVRRAVNRSRPYESWDIEPLIIKKTKGCSMPSRHVFSSTIIAMVFLKIFSPLGISLMVLSLFTGLLRIIGGVHYPSDVLIGFFCGIFAGLLV